MRTWNAILRIVPLVSMLALFSSAVRAESVAPSDGEVLSQMMAPLRQAVSVAVMGLHIVSPEDRQISAQALVNLLEGVNGEHFDPSVDGTLGVSAGLCAHLAQLRSSNGRGGLEDYIRLLELAVGPMLAVTEDGLTDQEMTDAFLTTSSLLSIAYTGFQGLLQDWEVEVWVRAGDSIQSAIDRAWPGAVLMIEPGVYRETLEIVESLTLRGVGGDVIIEPVAGQDGILISESARVCLEDLTVRRADVGIEISDFAECEAERIEVSSCTTGIRVLDLSSLTLSDARLRENGTALHGLDAVSMTISGCTIERSWGERAAVVLEDTVSASIDWTDIADGASSGVLVVDAVTAHIRSSLIRRNGFDGIVVAEASVVYLDDVGCYGNGGYGIRVVGRGCQHAAVSSTLPFAGHVACSRCSFADPVTGAGNGLGPCCPSDLEIAEP
jgi:hypothetical protein